MKHLAPHQTLAINRGEAQGVLSVAFDWDTNAVCRAAEAALLQGQGEAVNVLRCLCPFQALTRSELPFLEFLSGICPSRTGHDVATSFCNASNCLAHRP